MPPELREELLFIVPTNLVFVLGASLVGYYGVHQRPLLIVLGILLCILGYRVPQYLLYTNKPLTSIRQGVGEIALQDLISVCIGIVVVAFGISTGAEGFHRWNLSLIGLCGVLFVVGYILIHIPLNDALV